MRVIIVKSNHVNVHPQMVGTGKQRPDGSWEVTFDKLKSTMPGQESHDVPNVTVWFPESHVKEL